MSFENQLKAYIEKVNCELEKNFSERNCLQKSVYDAMSYSIMAGGKRLRPVISLAVCDMLGGETEDALRFGSAIEYIHTYSLIHDDLPCMDDDDLRRGMPTCHKKFGEANALLAGDGLLTGAFEYLSDMEKYKSVDPVTVIRAISAIAKAAGCDGMIGGQVVDLECEEKENVSEETLNYLHYRKTGALIRVAATVGALAAGASDADIRTVELFAEKLGLAFQIQDDILDCIGDESVLGKPIGSDAENGKTTYVTLMGLEGAREKSDAVTAEAVGLLEKYGEKADFVKKLALYLLDRKS
ncbi:MAG: polyprenyl synthetase family protein [Ruminococcaceae bacterium]|nr:polyprenyl synthetase family protein [Oscillospiraceae bacterium]